MAGSKRLAVLLLLAVVVLVAAAVAAKVDDSKAKAPGDAYSYDFYKRLGVTKTVTAKGLKQAFRKAALFFHPDRNKEKDAEAQFRNIYEAYETLIDPNKRREYDATGPRVPPPQPQSNNNNNNNNQQQQQHPPQEEEPLPRNFKFDYHDFFRHFDEAMAKHYEEHFKALHYDPDGQSTYTEGMDEHMRAHLAAAASAHEEALRAHHHHIHQLPNQNRVPPGLENEEPLPPRSGGSGSGSAYSSSNSNSRRRSAEASAAVIKSIWEDMDEDERMELQILRENNMAKQDGVSCRRVTKREGGTVTTVSECTQERTDHSYP